MSQSQPSAPRAVSLFDKLLTQYQGDDPRKPLGTIKPNQNGTKTTLKPRRDKQSGDGLRKKLEKRIEDQEKERQKVHFVSPPSLWERKRDERDSKRAATRTKAPRKNRNYPDCTKDALLEAFEKAGLPDYDKIQEHELHVTVVEPWEVKRPYIEKPATPPMKDLLAVFDATGSTISTVSARPSRANAGHASKQSASPSKRRRTRKSTEIEPQIEAGSDVMDDTVEPAEQDPVIDSPSDRRATRSDKSSLDANPFRRGIKHPTMASTPLVSGTARIPFSITRISSASASTSGQASRQEKTLTEINTFLEPKKRPARRTAKISVCAPVPMVSRLVPEVDSQETEISEGEQLGVIMVSPVKERSTRGIRRSSVSKPIEMKSRLPAPTTHSQETETEDEEGSATMVSTPKEKSDELHRRSNKISSTRSSIRCSNEKFQVSRNKSGNDTRGQTSSEDDTVIEAPVKKKSDKEPLISRRPSREPVKTTTIEVCPDSDNEDDVTPQPAEKTLPRAVKLFDQVFRRGSEGESGTCRSYTSKTSSIKEREGSMAKPTPRRPSNITIKSPNLNDESLRSRLSLDDSLPVADDSRMSKHLLRRPSNLSSFFGCSSTQTPSTYRVFNVVTDRRLHPTLKNINSSKLGSLLGNLSGFGNVTAFGKSAKKRQSRIKSIVPDLSNSRRLSKLSSCTNVAVNDPTELRDLIQHSIATAFNQTKVVFDDGEEGILEPADKVLALCDPAEIIPFEEALDKSFLKKITKIGEGSYGEVYKSVDSQGNDAILKIVPFDPEKSADEVFAQTLPELIICSTFNQLRKNNLNRTPNFINMTRAVTAEGKFPRILVEKWDEYDMKKPDGSENPDPRDYGDNHLHLLMFLNNGGTDLESHTFKSGMEAVSILLQVAFSLAAAELEYEFEHRDLHIGNVLVMATKEKEHTYLVDGAKYDVPTAGVTASIIDFSLSRLSKDGFVIHQDLSTDDELFKGSGDYQFDIYRKMKQETGNKWERFCPKTNIFWLHYLIGKMLAKKFTSRAKAHEAAIKSLKNLEKKILDFESCHQLILSRTIDDILKK